MSRKEDCIRKCVDMNAEEVSRFRETEVWREKVYPDSFTGVMCKGKCQTYKNSTRFRKCETEEWSKCQGSLKDCSRLIEEKCENGVFARISKAIFYP